MAHYNKRKKRWKARVILDGGEVFLGYFDAYPEAAEMEDAYLLANCANPDGCRHKACYARRSAQAAHPAAGPG